MTRRLLASIVFLLASATTAQTIDFEKIMLPIAILGELPGAFGSRWAARSTITNMADRAVLILGYSAYPLGGCQFLCPTLPPTPARITFSPIVAPGSSSQGAVLLVEKQFADSVQFHLRIQDLSRQSQTWGTEIPVIRERNLLNGKFQLLDVPLASGFRVTLRLYDPDAQINAQATLRFYKTNPALRSPIDTIFDPATGPPQPDPLLANRIVTLSVERRSSDPRFDIGYAELANLASVPELQGIDRIRIEIEPVTPGLRLWGFVSVTNNDTQHVTTITPQ